jgi:hypothetical protein
MRTIVIAAWLCSLANQSFAQDTQLGEASRLARSGGIATGKVIRNVLAASPEPTSCEVATWPNIPAECLQRFEAVRVVKETTAGPTAMREANEAPEPLMPNLRLATVDPGAGRVIMQISPSIMTVASD